MGKGAGQLLGEGEVDALVRGMGVGLGTNETEGDDLAVRVHLAELSEEGDRSSHAVRAGLLAVPELGTSFHDAFFEPGGKLSHAPSLSLTLRSASDLGVVWDISGQKLGNSGVSIIGVDLGRKSDGETHGGGGTANVTSGLDSGESSSTSDGHVGSPGVVEVHLVDTLLVHACDTFANVVLFVHLGSGKLSHEFGFSLESLGDLAVEFLTAHAGLRIVNTIEESTHDSHGLGYNTTDLTRVVTTLSGLDLDINADDTTKRGSHPELVPVEGTGIHAEHNVGGTDGSFREFEEFQQVGASRLFFSFENESESGVGESLNLQVLDSESA